jgi:hypothetical protein
MKSYVKLYGPGILEAIHALEKVETEMPQCSMWHALLNANPMIGVPGMSRSLGGGGGGGGEGLSYITTRIVTGPLQEDEEKAHRMISKSGHTLGDYDFFFEWHNDPTWQEIEALIQKVDAALKGLGVMYRINTR